MNRDPGALRSPAALQAARRGLSAAVRSALGGEELDFSEGSGPTDISQTASC